MKKTAIAPIVAVALLVIESLFGVKFPDTLNAQITDVIANAFAVYVVLYHGIMTNHKKEVKATPAVPATQNEPAPAPTSDAAPVQK